MSQDEGYELGQQYDFKPDDTKYSGTAYEAFMVSTSKLQKKFAARKKNKVARQARKLNRK